MLDESDKKKQTTILYKPVIKLINYYQNHFCHVLFQNKQCKPHVFRNKKQQVSQNQGISLISILIRTIVPLSIHSRFDKTSLQKKQRAYSRYRCRYEFDLMQCEYEGIVLYQYHIKSETIV